MSGSPRGGASSQPNRNFDGPDGPPRRLAWLAAVLLTGALSAPLRAESGTPF